MNTPEASALLKMRPKLHNHFRGIFTDIEELQKQRGELIEEIAECADQIATIDRQLKQT